MLSFEEYFDRIVSVQMQFDLARKALISFRETPQAVENYMQGELEEVRNLLLEGRDDQADQIKKHWAFTSEGTEKYFEGLKSHLSQGVDEVDNRINQNEFIMRVTLFEGFMKDIHREILRQSPTLLKADRNIPLGKIITLDKNDIIEEEIEREVQSLDRKNVKDRANYFKERLGIDWFGGTIIPLLERFLELRNQILHVNPDEKIEKFDIGLAHIVCFAIPWVTVAQAAVLYKEGFEMIEGLDEEKARSFIKT